MTAEQLLDFANKIGAAGVLLAFSLYMEWLIIGKTHRREIARLEEALAKAEKSEERWLTAVLELKGMTRHSMELVKEVKDASR
jgi:hypothetical protein